MKTWNDSRAYGNSPWSPPYMTLNRRRRPVHGRSRLQRAKVMYVLRGIASDGSLFTYDNVTVTVTK